LKTISAALAVTMFWQAIACAEPDPGFFKTEPDNPAAKSWALEILPPIPESVAVFEDAFHAVDSSMTVILIQDAHTNNSAQLNTAKALGLILEKEPFRYVFLEAGSGDESLSFLRKYADSSKRAMIAKNFLYQGKLQGSEFLDLTSDHVFTLWGVEDLGLYAKSVYAYRDVAKHRDKFKDYLERIETTIEILKPKLLNPLLLAFERNYERYQKEKISSIEYFRALIVSSILTEETATKVTLSRLIFFKDLLAINFIKLIEIAVLDFVDIDRFWR